VIWSLKITQTWVHVMVSSIHPFIHNSGSDLVICVKTVEHNIKPSSLFYFTQTKQHGKKKFRPNHP